MNKLDGEDLWTAGDMLEALEINDLFYTRLPWPHRIYFAAKATVTIYMQSALRAAVLIATLILLGLVVFQRYDILLAMELLVFGVLLGILIVWWIEHNSQPPNDN